MCVYKVMVNIFDTKHKLCITGCGHCKRLAPIYETVGNTFKNDGNCVVAKVDADGHRDLGSR